MSEQCALVDAWLYRSADVADDGLPPDDLVAHVADCPRCRVALIALLADRMGPAARPVDQDCAAIETEIPAFVDYERSNGLMAAARAFPDVWWHTLVCSDCDELYRALHELAAPPEELAPVAAARLSPWPVFEAELQLHPVVVSQFLSARRPLGAAWGEQMDDLIIAEQSGEIGLIQVLLRQEPPDKLAMVVRTDPPIIGTVVLAVGGESYSKPLDSDGYAVFSGLSETLFRGDKPAIKLTIHPPER